MDFKCSRQRNKSSVALFFSLLKSALWNLSHSCHRGIAHLCSQTATRFLAYAYLALVDDQCLLPPKAHQQMRWLWHPHLLKGKFLLIPSGQTRQGKKRLMTMGHIRLMMSHYRIRLSCPEKGIQPHKKFRETSCISGNRYCEDLLLSWHWFLATLS